MLLTKWLWLILEKFQSQSQKIPINVEKRLTRQERSMIVFIVENQTILSEIAGKEKLRRKTEAEKWTTQPKKPVSNVNLKKDGFYFLSK